ncbi:unnamed protein product [Hermetia illucens]|uniref:Uncharacterized protein n=1 Tax=Hermetia illucens TaxID=343691 RepID=A0A7R8UBL4_HERIL|nr:unnamed protein product [Hermetia illucens]
MISINNAACFQPSSYKNGLRRPLRLRSGSLSIQFAARETTRTCIGGNSASISVSLVCAARVHRPATPLSKVQLCNG